ncbi:MAG TPA: hypothetical protein VEL76_35220 [Gemmataceae bacterium]|nr:hypothetical protein [Gemmataceae bacterium]
MGANDLAAKLNRKPFEPFRIVTSDGTNYDIRHPDLVLVTTTSAHIGYPDPARPKVALQVDIVAIEHITRLEELPRVPGPAGAKGNGAEGA